jgi:signal transduction histidine kinase
MSELAARAVLKQTPRARLARRSLQRRVLLLVAAGVAILFAAFAVTSLLAIREGNEETLAESRSLAAVSANSVDYVVRQGLRSLDEVAFAEGVDIADEDALPEEQALRRAYFGSVFSAVYITDAAGQVRAREPANSGTPAANIAGREHVRAALAEGRPTVTRSSLAAAGPGSAVVSFGMPIRDRSGEIVGMVGADISLEESWLVDILRPSVAGEGSYTQLVDTDGTILASTRAGELLQQSDHERQVAGLIENRLTVSGECHSCHAAPDKGGAQERENEVMAFAPVQSAPWGVLIRRPESAAASEFTRRAITFGVPAFAVALLFAWAVVRSVVRPVGALTSAAERLASGELSEPVPPMGKDEIGELARAFETMRLRLKDALETIERWAGELEGRVQERTHELELSRDHLQAVASENAALNEELKRKDAARTELLNKVIGAQEEERRRIARELHDETSQALTVLVMGMETAAGAGAQEPVAAKEKLDRLKTLAVKTLDDVHRLIYDLRPAVLDDLGLVPGLRWYAEERLRPAGIRPSVLSSGDERRLPPEVETALFRIGQEAISNIARHAGAANAFIGVTFQPNGVVLEVEDDGRGFEPGAVRDPAPGTGGWGLLGMRERASLLGGSLDLTSEPGAGTRLEVTIPLAGGE